VAPAPVFRRAGTVAIGLLIAAAASAAAAPAAGAKPFGCLIEPDRIAEVGSQVVGVVDSFAVDRGDTVKAGQPLASLRADVERANAHVAEVRSKVDADVRAAAANLELARQKVKRSEALVAQNFISDQALEQARAEYEVAAQKLNQARGQQQIWIQERRVAEAQLGLRTVRSPLKGVVVERYVNVGERVEERPLMRVAVIDPLRVELMVPTAQYGTLKRGDLVSIRPELPGAEPVSAAVSHVDKVMDAASNTFRVRLRLPNPGHRLPAGLRCKAELPAGVATAGAGVATSSSPPARPVALPRSNPGSL
jgi:cobalt-zinc-cadmium efflux system membrane fusion protein